jgi:hypothetical protein
MGLPINKQNKLDMMAESINIRTYEHYLDRLTELSVSMFDWKNVPPEIDVRYLERVLFDSGKILFFYDKDLGEYLVMKFTSTGKVNIYDVPYNRHAYANNGYSNNLDDTNSVIIYNNLIRTPAQIDVGLYAQKLATLDRIIDVNANAQKTPVLIETDDEKKRTTLVNLYKQYSGNHPFVFAYKGFAESIKAIDTKAPFVAPELYTLKTQIWNEALTYLGISNINITKKERLITDEVTRNQGGTIASRYSRLEARRSACKKINDMFNLNIEVNFKEDYQSTELLADDTLTSDEDDSLNSRKINGVERIASKLEPDTEEQNTNNSVLDKIRKLLKG